ncbi:PF05899 family protein [Leptospira fainei serovar Hurstbridge str. BUT 6]|uniref:PF05899 family protein n=1 Tax=Leptospira fainei serovar Hurstbridge str. BUT 6 TaxID=1193011 RepID=S3UTB5_9LEPT|nr:cupin domain-containing protein [Leptospira fainei]EPG73661.1 PF05899 family protein [Leptospira fainei serovar Hurstbridge str. BUT 6]
MENKVYSGNSIVFMEAMDLSDSVPYPIAEIIEGNPDAKIKVLRTKGARTNLQHVSVISAQPSKFHYKFQYDEAFQLIHGHLTILLDSGEQIEMRPGDILTVPAGHDSIFEIYEPSLKFVVVTCS